MWKDFMRKVSYKAEIQALKEENKRLKEDLRHEYVMVKYWSRKAFFWKEKALALEWGTESREAEKP